MIVHRAIGALVAGARAAPTIDGASRTAPAATSAAAGAIREKNLCGSVSP
jgi:hypothetical protein